MRTVECKKLGSVTSLTVGKVYNIIEETNDRFSIENDKGVQMRYGKNLFNNPVEVPVEDNPLLGLPGAPVRRGPGRPRGRAVGQEGRMLAPEMAQVPAPAPAPVPVVNQIQINTSASNSNGLVSFRVESIFLQDVVHTYSTGNIISTNGISASCGIQSLSGLDELRYHITQLRSEFTIFVNENRGRFILAGDIDLNLLFEEIAVALVQDLVASYQGGDADIKAGILILSTTEDSIRQEPCLRRALNNASAGNIPVYNPNSGNDIVMWNIPVEA
jgi:hypothetical protein